MTTEFYVYPSIPRIPTFGEVIEGAQNHILAFLRDYKIDKIPAFPYVAIYLKKPANEPNQFVRVARMDEPFWWPPTFTHVVYIGWEHAGGTLAWTDEFSPWYEWDAPDATERQRASGPYMEKARALNRSWSFLIGGSTGFASFAYGMLALSLAELTDGIIHSEDGAWDYEQLPMRPAEFLRVYFRPETRTNSYSADATRYNIGRFAQDLTGTWSDDDVDDNDDG